MRYSVTVLGIPLEEKYILMICLDAPRIQYDLKYMMDIVGINVMIIPLYRKRV